MLGHYAGRSVVAFAQRSTSSNSPRAKGFCKDYEAAIEIDDIEHFRNRHRRCKLLVIDDLDFIFSKTSAQEELMATLDVHQAERRPVIITTSRLPHIDSGILPGLASRLVSATPSSSQRPVRRRPKKSFDC